MNYKRIIDSENKSNWTFKVAFRGYYNPEKESFEDSIVPKIISYIKDSKLSYVVIRLDYNDKKSITLDEVDIYCSKLQIKAFVLIPSESVHEVIITTDEASGLALTKLFINLGKIGNPGHSFSLSIADKQFYFDGDGADAIDSVNGCKLTSEFMSNTNKQWEPIKTLNPDKFV